jgi:glycosyltransferase involved in cell wall biosynthesis
MNLSVIIATKNEGKNIERLMTSLKKQTYQDFEIIIVDNFSNDNTCNIASRFTKKIFQKGPERSSQRNFGLTKAQGQYVLFIDADMELEKEVLEECYTTMQRNPKISGIIIDEISVGSGFLSKVKALEKKLYTGQEDVEAARFFKKKDLERIGGYDENLTAGEDWDLSQRAKRLGGIGRISAKILHHEDSSLVSDVKKKYYYAKQIHKYALKNPQDFKRLAGIGRFLMLFKKPKIILNQPIEFLGLLFLKLTHYLAYLVARFNY